LGEVLAKYMNYLLSKKCLKPTTIKRKVVTIKSLMRHGVNLSDPDSFVRFLNKTSWASGTKDVAVDSYHDYLNMIGLTEVKLPHIRREDKLPFIPQEKELDAQLFVEDYHGSVPSLVRKVANSEVEWNQKWSSKWEVTTFQAIQNTQKDHWINPSYCPVNSLQIG
jgi:hypothetical protein